MTKDRLGRAITLVLLTGCACLVAAKTPLNPESIPRFAEPLPLPERLDPVEPQHYTIGAYQIEQQILPRGLPKTTLWAFGAQQQTARYPGPTIEVEHKLPVNIRWASSLPASTSGTSAPTPAQVASASKTISFVRGIQHLSLSDGDPSQWRTPGASMETLLTNEDLPGTFWYQPNASTSDDGNRSSALLGMYIIRDTQKEKPWNLPQGRYEIPLVIEDRDFDEDGNFQSAPASDSAGYGNVIVVNGKAWPHLEVSQHRYRIRILNAAKRRFFKLAFEMPSNTLKPKMYQIGADGGYFKRPIPISNVVLGPGEIADLVVDFLGYRTGMQFELVNSAATPYPNGTATTGSAAQVMQFRMVPSGSEPLLASDLDNLQDRVMASVESPTVSNYPVRSFLVREMATQKDDLVSTDIAPVEHQDLRLPDRLEIWEMINPTSEVQVLHVDSMYFHLLSHQAFRVTPYLTALNIAELGAINKNPAKVPAPTRYLLSEPTPASGGELLWKPTVRINPGEVTRFIARSAPGELLRPPMETAEAVRELEDNLRFTANWPASFRSCDCSPTPNHAETERRVTMAGDTRLLDTQRVGH